MMDSIKSNLKNRQKLQSILSLGLFFSSLLFTSNAFCDLKFEQEFTVVKVIQNHDLWWFDGENAANYYEEVTLTAQGVSTGTFKWDVIAGVDKVDLENGKDTIILSDNTVKVRSTSASGSIGDVTIMFTYDGIEVCQHKLTVYAPDSAVVIRGPIDNEAKWGYETIYTFEVRDQFGAKLPQDIEVNESFSPFESDWWLELWPSPTPYFHIAKNASFDDAFGPMVPMIYPSAVHPGEPGSDDKVKHATQYYRAGSITIGKGRVIKVHTLQFYRGKARQE